MLKNYLKIALRNLQKHKGYAAINLFGLAIGMAASLLILQYVIYERSYDDFHEQGEAIYRVQFNAYNQGTLEFESATAFPRVGPAMKEDFPEVEEFARLYLRYGGGVVRYEDQSFKEDLLFQADPSFLTMFSYPMLRGDRNTALVEPNTAVVSEEIARKYFGDEDPLGQRFRFGNREEYTITGVIASPEHSHLKINFLLSYPTLVQLWGEYFETAWGWYDFYNYIKLAPGADPAALEAKFPDFIARNDDDENARETTRFVLQPLQEIHLSSHLIQEARVNGDGTAVYFLSLIAFFILVIAWFNYINLATARAIERAKEIGVRKVVGAYRRQLVRQFILESVLLNVIAAVLGLALWQQAQPLFSALVGKTLEMNVLENGTIWAGLAGVFLIGAFLSGMYPAFVLSSYKPATVLKGAFGTTHRGLHLRKTLVIGQFVASVGLIAGTMIVYQQLTFMRDQNLGIDIDQTLVINGPGILENDSLYADQVGAFKQEMVRQANIRSVAASTEIPGNLIYWTRGSRKLGDDPETMSPILYQVGIDYDYLDAYGHRLLAGRGYAPDFTADSASVILNESALNVLGFPDPERTVGQQIVTGGDTLSVVGVVADYHQEGLQHAYRQTAFLLRPNARSYYSMKVHTADLSATLGFINEQYTRFFPDNPFTYFFLDDHFDTQYRSYRQFGEVFGFFALLAIVVACLGLFGLSLFTATQRAKEIGIRKVLGSSVTNILVLLSKDFVKLVLVGSLIAVPLVWYVMDQWLESFAFRIELSGWTFLLAGSLALAIALLTVSYQSIRTALANPVQALRYE